MIATVRPGRLSGAVRVPASKSAAHRLLIGAALADAPTRLRIGALNNDIEATAACLRALGATIERVHDGLEVTPIQYVPDAATLDCGESGSTLRFLLPVACALGANARFVGHGRLPQRPNAPLVEALRRHGAAIDADRLPIDVSATLSGGQWTLPGDVSSQYVTALLFALPLLAEDSEIILTTPLQSAGYVDMTLQALHAFGVAAEPAPDGWRVPGGQKYRSPGAIEVEGDWSAAAFWCAANAMGSNIQLDGLSDATAQGDRAILSLLGQPVIDAANVPDLVPALAVAAAALPQRTVITGAARLRLKESDRLESVAALLRALGGSVEITADGLIIEGGHPLRGGEVNGFGDHRIVMAAAVAATVANAPVRILGAEAVAKSYPDFFSDFNRLGGQAHVE